MPEHAEPHFDANGLCRCDCQDCLTRPIPVCVCGECACDDADSAAPRH